MVSFLGLLVFLWMIFHVFSGDRVERFDLSSRAGWEELRIFLSIKLRELTDPFRDARERRVAERLGRERLAAERRRQREQEDREEAEFLLEERKALEKAKRGF